MAGCSRDLSYPQLTPVTLTTAGWTTILAAVADARIFVVEIYAANDQAASVGLLFREGTGNPLTFEVPQGSLCLFPYGWLLATNTALQARLDAVGNVVISGFYTYERE